MSKSKVSAVMLNLIKIMHHEMTPKIFRKGEIIVEDGAPSDGMMYIISEGNVDVYKNYGKQDEVCVGHLTQGDFFGEMSLFLDKKRTATIVARDDVSAYMLSRTNMLEIIVRRPEVAFSFIEILCMRLDSTNASVANIHTNEVTEE